jgi:hypothetical protein
LSLWETSSNYKGTKYLYGMIGCSRFMTSDK